MADHQAVEVEASRQGAEVEHNLDLAVVVAYHSCRQEGELHIRRSSDSLDSRRSCREVEAELADVAAMELERRRHSLDSAVHIPRNCRRHHVRLQPTVEVRHHHHLQHCPFRGFAKERELR